MAATSLLTCHQAMLDDHGLLKFGTLSGMTRVWSEAALIVLRSFYAGLGCGRTFALLCVVVTSNTGDMSQAVLCDAEVDPFAQLWEGRSAC